MAKLSSRRAQPAHPNLRKEPDILTWRRGGGGGGGDDDADDDDDDDDDDDRLWLCAGVYAIASH